MQVRAGLALSGKDIDVLWLEEPTAVDDYDGMAKVREVRVQILVCRTMARYQNCRRRVCCAEIGMPAIIMTASAEISRTVRTACPMYVYAHVYTQMSVSHVYACCGWKS